MGNLLPTIVSLSAGLIIGIIGFFLKRTIGRVDKCETDIDDYREKIVTKNVHEKAFDECKKDIEKIREDYTPKNVHEKDFDECKNDIKQIKEDYIMKEDFYRELGKVDRKLDYITDILLQRGGKTGE